jgi:hypothetical protein
MPKPQSPLTMPLEPQAKRRTKSIKKEKLIPPPEGEVLDEDAVLKTFFTQNAEDFVAIAMPDLHAAVNWLVPIEFCEQELINFLRGRLRQIDKRKVFIQSFKMICQTNLLFVGSSLVC